MKITDNRLRMENGFGKLNPGDIFFSPADYEYYMVTSTITTEMEELNAVCLSNGQMDSFYPSDKIEMVVAELVISG